MTKRKQPRVVLHVISSYKATWECLKCSWQTDEYEKPERKVVCEVCGSEFYFDSDPNG